MRARDVMTTKVITVDPHMLVAKIAALLIARHISAVPVVEPDGTLVGIVSEGGAAPSFRIGFGAKAALLVARYSRR